MHLRMCVCRHTYIHKYIHTGEQATLVAPLVAKGTPPLTEFSVKGLKLDLTKEAVKAAGLAADMIWKSKFDERLDFFDAQVCTFVNFCICMFVVVCI